MRVVPLFHAALRVRAFVGGLVAVCVALPGGGSALAESLPEAARIRGECTAARSALRDASALADKPSDAYRAALRDGEAHLDAAFRLADAAEWPAAMPATHASVLTSLTETRLALSRLSRPSRLRRKPRSRRNLDREVARLGNVIALVELLVPRQPSRCPSLCPRHRRSRRRCPPRRERSRC